MNLHMRSDGSVRVRLTERERKALLLARRVTGLLAKVTLNDEDRVAAESAAMGLEHVEGLTDADTVSKAA